MVFKQTLGELVVFLVENLVFRYNLAKNNLKKVMSYNRPHKHVMLTKRLAFTSLINFYLNLWQKKSLTLKHTYLLI